LIRTYLQVWKPVGGLNDWWYNVTVWSASKDKGSVRIIYTRFDERMILRDYRHFSSDTYVAGQVWLQAKFSEVAGSLLPDTPT
jgi:hypothetical protein